MSGCLVVGFAGVERAVVVHLAASRGARVRCLESLDGLPSSNTHPRLVWNPTGSENDCALDVSRLVGGGYVVVCAVNSASSAAAALDAGAIEVLTRPWTDETFARLDRVFQSRERRDRKRRLEQSPQLRATELRVLEYLAAHTDRFVTAEELQHEVLGTHGDGSAVRYHVSQLRRRLGPRAVIETRPKFGYRLEGFRLPLSRGGADRTNML